MKTIRNITILKEKVRRCKLSNTVDPKEKIRNGKQQLRQSKRKISWIKKKNSTFVLLNVNDNNQWRKVLVKV